MVISGRWTSARIGSKTVSCDSGLHALMYILLVSTLLLSTNVCCMRSAVVAVVTAVEPRMYRKMGGAFICENFLTNERNEKS